MLWVILICVVIIGSLSPAGSSVLAAVNKLHLNDKVEHFCAYLALSLLPVVGFRNRRSGLKAGFAMFLLGLALEGGQNFSPGRSVDMADVLANGAGVSCGALLAFPIRAILPMLWA